MAEPMLNDYPTASMNYGAKEFTITNPAGAAMTITSENVTLSRPTTSIQARNHLNVPKGQVLTTDFVSGSALCQIDGTAWIQNGAAFAAAIGSAASENWIVSEAGAAYSQGEQVKQPISFVKKINA